MLLVKTVSLFTVFICVLSFSIHHEFPVKGVVSTIFSFDLSQCPVTIYSKKTRDVFKLNYR